VDPDATALDVILDAAAIAAHVDRIAAEIAATTRDRPLVAMPVLFGALFFGPDLVRRLLARGVEVADVVPVTVSSYGASPAADATVSSGEPLVRGLPRRPSIEGRDVLVIDTIVDTGATIERLAHDLSALGATSVRTACLLDKVARRARPVAPTWRGITAPDRFLVGYGLDLSGRWRGLPVVGAIGVRDPSPTGRAATSPSSPPRR